jgi:ABC-type transport system involved in multi-copper enzyme maturation permease subunit
MNWFLDFIVLFRWSVICLSLLLSSLVFTSGVASTVEQNAFAVLLLLFVIITVLIAVTQAVMQAIGELKNTKVGAGTLKVQSSADDNGSSVIVVPEKPVMAVTMTTAKAF